jgi:ABC-type Mn2+/Zn2+ transport system permease subunit
MFDILDYTFMQRAIAASVLIGLVCSVMGVYVVLRGLAFIGAGIAHASFGGVALGVVLGINPLFTAAVFCVATAWSIGIVSRAGKVKEDTAIGIFFASTMALGILLIGLLHEYNTDLFGYLFGSVLAISKSDLWLTVGLSVGVLGVVALFYKELLFITFDPEAAEASGLPARALYFLLLGLLAVTIVVSLKVIGIILVSALLVTPAAAAYQLTTDFRKMMVLSAFFGAFSALTGLTLSYVLDTASGATIVLTATGIFFVTALVSRRRKSLRTES